MGISRMGTLDIEFEREREYPPYRIRAYIPVSTIWNIRLLGYLQLNLPINILHTDSKLISDEYSPQFSSLGNESTSVSYFPLVGFTYIVLPSSVAISAPPSIFE